MYSTTSASVAPDRNALERLLSLWAKTLDSFEQSASYAEAIFSALEGLPASQRPGPERHFAPLTAADVADDAANMADLIRDMKAVLERRAPAGVLNRTAEARAFAQT